MRRSQLLSLSYTEQNSKKIKSFQVGTCDIIILLYLYNRRTILFSDFVVLM